MTHSRSARLWTAGLAAAAVIAGCRVGPNYEAPPEDTGPNAFMHTSPEGFDVTSTITPARPPEVVWWETFEDPVLNDLISRALAGSLNIRLAEARIREARAFLGIVSTDALPQINANAEFQRQRVSAAVPQGTFGDRTRNLFLVGFDATWELDVFGGNARAIEAAEADIDATLESRRDIIVTLLSEVARNYVELRGFQGRLEIARKNIDLQQQTLDLTTSRFKAGLTNEVDVAQARSTLARTQAIVPALDDGAQRAIHRLGVLLGEQPTALHAELSSAGAIPVPPAEIGVGVPSELLRRRPDIRRAERELAAATARIGVATADLFPRFSLTGAFGYQSARREDFADGDARFWYFGPAMRWPIFQFGRVRSAIGVENARTDQALVRYEQAVLISLEDVENAMVSFTREQARRRSLSEAVDADQRAFDLSKQLYANGLTDFLRVLDSQRALQLSEDALVDSRRAVSTNLIALYKALGGGWEPAEPADEQQEARR